jgi:hypothetical protein
MPAAFGAATVRAETPRLAPPARSYSRALSVSGRLPGLPYVTAPPVPLTDMLPGVQLPFGAKPRQFAPDAAPRNPLAANESSRVQQLLYRPSDIGVFTLQHPLLTPKTPVHLNLADAPHPDSGGIVELPVVMPAEPKAP